MAGILPLRVRSSLSGKAVAVPIHEATRACEETSNGADIDDRECLSDVRFEDRLERRVGIHAGGKEPGSRALCSVSRAETRLLGNRADCT
ncbi:hypothetical protein PsYK624_102670 [Phanerochaete sordida]|uniref:Uncharacterized protein n=1 Tax=Phanerochaete sordida TaxID=48140 RepID=A0A9P3GI99_9APHY|nr:hypothetical protein PsYK624_102670 [Phanerochaete sordida]